MDALISGKVGALFALIALTIAFGAIPRFLVWWTFRSQRHARRQERIIKYLNCFGGGVFLGALLLHLMVEGAEEFEDFKTDAGFDNEYPFFNLFVAAGFFIVAFIEYLIHAFLSVPHNNNDDVTHHSGGHRHFIEDNDGPSRIQTKKSMGNGKTGESVVAVKYGSITPDQRTTEMPSGCVDHHHDNEIEFEFGGNLPSGGRNTKTSAGQATSGEDEDKNGTGKGSEHDASCAMTYSYASSASPIRAFLLLVAFSFHTIFDGLAVGLQDSSFQLWEMFTAIAIHKCIVAFCLGMELFSKYVTSPRKAFLWIVVFSLMSPIGICIGIYLTSGGVNDEARHLSSGILQGMAAGTFMYVTFLEILSYYWSTQHGRHLLDIVFALIGFGCMAGVKYLDKD